MENKKNQQILKYFLYASILLGLITFLEFILGQGSSTGPFLIGALLFAAIGALSNSKLKGFSFSLFIFSGTACALYYPFLFTSIGGYALKGFIIPLLTILMFAMGTHLSFGDFLGIVRTPKPVIIGIVCHYIIMPIIGFLLANAVSMPPEIAAGIILVGCCPSGMASNVMAYISGGNLPLSVTVTALSTLMAPIMTPVLMKLLAGHFIAINFWEMLWDIMKLVILPIIAGLIYNKIVAGRFSMLNKLLPKISMIAIVLIIIIITAAGRNSLLSMGPLLILLVFIHNVTGYFLGYRLSKWFGLREDEARTIAFEVGMQNAGMASGLALKMGYVATMGLAPAIFGPMQNITASTLAAWFKNRSQVSVIRYQE